MKAYVRRYSVQRRFSHGAERLGRESLSVWEQGSDLCSTTRKKSRTRRLLAAGQYYYDHVLAA